MTCEQEVKMKTDVVYSIAMFKLGEGVSEERCEEVVSKFSSMWIQATGCKEIILLENIYLPWPSAEVKYDYDYIAVAVWDKEDAIKFEEAGGLNSPSVQGMMAEMPHDLALDMQHISTNFTDFGYFQAAARMTE